MTGKLEDNPFIKAPDYYEGYNQKIKELRNRPEVVAMDKMCYELFEATPLGKQFMQYVEERYLMSKFVEVSHPNYSDACIFYEGFREAFRLLRASVLSHKQRIRAAANSNEPEAA